MKRVLRIVLSVALVVGAVALIVRLGQQLPKGPVPIAWDDAVCAECGMHVGDPAFAAQLQTLGGDVLAFDDPGCLLRFEATSKPRVHAIYFHAFQGERWLRASAASFLRVPRTPMGYGLAAVPRGTPEALTTAEARRAVARFAPVTPEGAR